MASGRIFISYRRGADDDSAGRLYDRLRQALPEDQIFRDVDSAADLLGLDFERILTDRVQECSAQIAVIGTGWIADAARLRNPSDFVRIELEAGLARSDLRVIPVLVGGAEMPNPSDLPESLHQLCRRGGIKLTNEGYTDGINTILRVLEQAMEPPQHAAPQLPDPVVPPQEDPPKDVGQTDPEPVKTETAVPHPSRRSVLIANSLSYVAYGMLAVLALSWAWTASVLRSDASALVDDVLSMGTRERIELVRTAAAPVEQYASAPAENLLNSFNLVQSALAEETESGFLEVFAANNKVTVRIPASRVFTSASAVVLPEIRPLLTKIADLMDNSDGLIVVTVHSDNVPVRTARFPSNLHLSLWRADSVSRVLGQALSNPGRLTEEGRGEFEPIASNETAGGRSKNRRVELTWRPLE